MTILTSLWALIIAILILDVTLTAYLVFISGVPFRVIWDEWRKVSREFWLGGWGKR